MRSLVTHPKHFRNTFATRQTLSQHVRNTPNTFATLSQHASNFRSTFSFFHCFSFFPFFCVSFHFLKKKVLDILLKFTHVVNNDTSMHAVHTCMVAFSTQS